MVLFSDGQAGSTMETAGDFSAWTSTTGTPTVTTTDKHHGSNSMTCDASGDFASKTFAEQATLYAQIALRVSAMTLNNFEDLAFLDFYATATLLARAVFQRMSATTFRWKLVGRNAAALESATSGSITFDSAMWYTVKMKALVDNAVGEYRLYVDGTNILSLTGKDTNNYGNVTQIDTGMPFAESASADYVDCVVVDSADINLESSYSPSTRSSLRMVGVGLASKIPKWNPRKLNFPNYKCEKKLD